MKLREKAYESFQQRLMALDLRPGQFVSQRELVALTGMPLGAIRELIPRLEADGLIVTIPQRGMQIAAVDLKLVGNAFQLRIILEKEAIASFAVKARTEEIEALADAYDRIVAKSRKGISRELLEEAQTADWAFHDALIDSLGNDILSAIYRVNSIKIRLIRLDRVLLSPDNLMPALKEHGDIIAALRARDSARAVMALERHLTSARNRAMGVQTVDTLVPPAAPRSRPRSAKVAR